MEISNWKNARRFWTYLRKKINKPELSRYLDEYSNENQLLVFSGVIRDFFLERDVELRDLDLVVEDADHFVKEFKDVTKNSFGGYKIKFEGLTIDVWSIDNTWAFKELRISELEWDIKKLLLPRTAFFNFNAIVYDYKMGQFICASFFEEFLKNKQLDYVNKTNPLPELCIVNTYHYMVTLGLPASDRLIKNCQNDLGYQGDDKLSAIQLKHFGEILYHPATVREYFLNNGFGKYCFSPYVSMIEIEAMNVPEYILNAYKKQINPNFYGKIEL